MVDSLPYNEEKGCPSGYHKRSSYTSRRGHRVPPRCVKSTTVYSESSRNFKRRMTARRESRLKAMGHSTTSHKLRCPSGQKTRRAYVRKINPEIIQRGYTVKRASGRMYRVHPTKEQIYVKPGCIKKQGKSSIAPGEGFGILRKGELKKYGYAYENSEETRHNALKKAVKEYGGLGVFRKLDAVAKLSKNTVPKASNIFKKDRDWIRQEFGLKAPQ